MAQFAIDAIVLRQQGRELYCFGMSSVRLRRVCYVTPRSHDDPDEIQRILNPHRAKEIGDYIKQANSLLPNSIVVSLTPEVQVQSTGNPAVKSIHFPADDGKFAYILDGQHRLEGFKYSDGIEFDLPVVAIYDADDSLRGKIFADINSKQERVSDVHLLSLYYQIKELPVDETPVMDVVAQLNSDQNSPLRGRIRMMDGDRGTWIKNTALKQWLSPHLTSGGVLAPKTVAEKATIMKEYFRACSVLWPEAWGDLGKFNLCRPIGFEIVIALFAPVKHRCDLNASRQYTAATFASQMAPLKGAVIDLPLGAQLPLDWRRGPMGILSNRATRTLISRQLSDVLRRADDGERQ
ncbi:MAG: DGQHR domain-containing protein [Gemmatimonadales bacterium]|jgi:DGQHR domain-containing protein